MKNADVSTTAGWVLRLVVQWLERMGADGDAQSNTRCWGVGSSRHRDQRQLGLGAVAGPYNGIAGYAHVSSTAAPPGANNWSCRPSAAHPRPIVLVHGTFADMSDSWQALSPLLVNNGYCVFALNYGSNAGSGALGITRSATSSDPPASSPAS